MAGGEFNQVALWKIHAALATSSMGFAIYSVLSKVAMTAGVNALVFSAYRDFIGFCVLAPFAFIVEREVRSKISLPVFGLMVCLGFFGFFIQQTLFLVGLDFTSVVLATAVHICTPIFVLVIAAIFGLEEVRIGKREGQAKILGVLLCILGAMVLLFYKGPSLLPRLTSLANYATALPQTTPPLSRGVFAELLIQWWPGISKWQIGALCLISSTLSLAIYINLQVPALARFPAPISLMAGSILSGTILLFLAAVATVKDPSKWVLSGVSQILPLVYAGIITSGGISVLMCWSNQRGGPIFAGAYTPMTTFVSSIFGYYFLGESIFLGWVIGAVSIICGLYFVTWGKLKHQQQRALLLDLVDPPIIQPIFPLKPASHLEDPLLG